MMQLEYFPPYQSFGRPLTPEILEAIGIITRHPPARVEDDGVNHFEFWTTTSRRGVLYDQGHVTLTPRVGRIARRLDVQEVRRGREPTEQREHAIDAGIECGADALWSPLRWRYTSVMRAPTGRVLPEASLVEEAVCTGRVVERRINGRRERETLPGHGVLAAHWGLWEAVRHLPREKGFVVRFDCLEHLRKLKPGHTLRFLDSTEPTIAGRVIRLHRFLQHGRGILPTEYLVDDQDRVLLVIDANRAAVAAALRPVRSSGKKARPRMMPTTASARPARAKDAPPNILFVCTDQQHWRALSAAGNRDLATPAMDALCRRGVRLDAAYCTNPICSPSRSSLFTGRMPSETGVNRLNSPEGIRPELPTIGQWLGSRASYDCVYAGKWHVPQCHSYQIPGFRVLAAGQDHRGDISDVTVSHAVEGFLRRPRGEPFLLAASLTQPHDICDWLRLNQQHKRVPPYPLPPNAFPAWPPLPPNFRSIPREQEYVRRYRDEKCEPNIGGWDAHEWRWYLWNYYRMVEMADAELGRILAALEATKQTENTVVVFTSDHGEGLGEHRLDRKNFHYEAAIRVPLLFSCPGRLPARAVRRHALASGIDLMPTFCGFAGVDPPELTTAVDLRPLLLGKVRAARECVGVEMSVRAVGRVARTRHYKYSVFEGDPMEQLFDLEDDPGETRNLAARRTHAAILREHREHLAEWERRLAPAPDAPGAGVFLAGARLDV